MHDLNVNKTKEMINDFRDKKPILEHLGSMIDDKLNCNKNIEVYQKANQCMYFVKKLKKYYIDKSIMSMFINLLQNLC